MKNKNRGITLIALVITIIVLLILAGVTIAMLTGNNGILTKAREAKDEYEKGAEKEQEDLDKLYSSIKVADGSQVTLTMEELDTYIENKMKEKLFTGTELDQYIENKMKEKLFTGTELIKEPMTVGTTTTWQDKSKDFTLENSIQDYEFLLFRFGTFNTSSGTTGNWNTLLVSVNEIVYNDISRKMILAAADGSNFSSATAYFKDDKTLCIKETGASNDTRKYFAIDSIKGIK